MMADMEIYAENLDEAIQKAEEAMLPEGEYIDSSFEVNTELLYQNTHYYGEQKKK